MRGGRKENEHKREMEIGNTGGRNSKKEEGKGEMNAKGSSKERGKKRERDRKGVGV